MYCANLALDGATTSLATCNIQCIRHERWIQSVPTRLCERLQVKQFLEDVSAKMTPLADKELQQLKALKVRARRLAASRSQLQKANNPSHALFGC